MPLPAKNVSSVWSALPALQSLAWVPLSVAGLYVQVTKRVLSTARLYFAKIEMAAIAGETHPAQPASSTRRGLGAAVTKSSRRSRRSRRCHPMPIAGLRSQSQGPITQLRKSGPLNSSIRLDDRSHHSHSLDAPSALMPQSDNCDR